MKIYLTRHGEANTADKSLSDEGRRDVDRVAAFLSKNKGIRLQKVFHSGKTRAEQTAAILAGAVAPDVSIEKVDGINPNDSVDPFAEQIRSWTQDTLVVGHLPYMGKLVSSLVFGEEINAVIFAAATTVCLERIEGQWMIAWVVGPEII